MKLLIVLLVCCGLLVLSLNVPDQPGNTGGRCQMRGVLPDPICTPGSTNPNVTVLNLKETICLRGWTATVRPPVTYTKALKVQQMQDYGFTDSPAAHEEDHLIPLSIGGHPTDPKNLWPQPEAAPNPKDAVENKLHDAVCSGAMSLGDAQKRIATDWQTAIK
jgi:hypothetical protein